MEERRESFLYIMRQRFDGDVEFSGNALVNFDDRSKTIVRFDEQSAPVPSRPQGVGAVQEAEGEVETSVKELRGQGRLAPKAVDDPRAIRTKAFSDIEQFAPSTYAMDDQRFTQLISQPDLHLKELDLQRHRRLSQPIEAGLTDHHNLRMGGPEAQQRKAICRGMPGMNTHRIASPGPWLEGFTGVDAVHGGRGEVSGRTMCVNVVKSHGEGEQGTGS